MIRKNTLFQLCKDYDLRLTDIRKSLLEKFVHATRPLSYDDCKENLRMDKATFYRNMRLFEDTGLVRKIESDDKRWYFELAGTEHAHFVCRSCHGIECLEALPHQPLKGYSVDSVIYKGTCRKCSA